MDAEPDRPPGPASAAPLVRYRSPDEDSARWWDFALRPGDIVVSTRSKSGTTWVQMICLLLVFGTPQLPGALGELSPWLDWLVQPRDEVYARLDAQTHRRVIKTHTPLDGVPLDARATYVVVGRHPLDMAVSLYHHGGNIDRRRMAELTGRPEVVHPPRPPLHEWLVAFVDWDGDARRSLDTLPGAMLHLSDAWSRRDDPGVVLVHYDDLVTDLDGSMRRLSARLGITVDEERWPGLVRAATFESMRSGAAGTPDARLGVLKDPAAFFRRGRSGEGRQVLTAGELDHYRERVAAMAPRDLLLWLHRDGAIGM
jgi:aryl sulfotransferase